MGKISCTPEQLGAIQTILGINEGKLSDSTKLPKQEEEKHEDDDIIKDTYVNANYVSL